LQIAAASLDDPGDTSRPAFSSEASVSGLAILLSVPRVDDFIDLIEAFSGIWSLNELNRLTSKFKDIKTPGVKSVPPDWNSFNLKSIEGFNSLHKILSTFLANIKGNALTVQDTMGDLQKMLEKKAAKLVAAVQGLKDWIDAISGAVGATGLYVLDIPTAPGGTEYMKSQLSGGYFEGLNQGSYSVLIVYAAGNAGIPALDVVKTLLL